MLLKNAAWTFVLSFKGTGSQRLPDEKHPQNCERSNQNEPATRTRTAGTSMDGMSGIHREITDIWVLLESWASNAGQSYVYWWKNTAWPCIISWRNTRISVLRARMTSGCLYWFVNLSSDVESELCTGKSWDNPLGPTMNLMTLRCPDVLEAVEVVARVAWKHVPNSISNSHLRASRRIQR